MIQVFGQILPNAVGVAMSVIPIVTLLLLIMGERGRTSGPMFALGWIMGIVAIVGVAPIFGFRTSGSGPSAIHGWGKVGFGVLFLFLAFRQWQQRPVDDAPAPLPGWMQGIDSITAPKALGMGLGLSVANAKNLPLLVGSAFVLSAANLSSGQAVGVTMLFVGVASATIVGPVVATILAGDAAAYTLSEMKNWLVKHNHAITVIVFGFMGTSTLSDAIRILTTI